MSSVRSNKRIIHLNLPSDALDWLDSMAREHSLPTRSKAARCCVNCAALTAMNLDDEGGGETSGSGGGGDTQSMQSVDIEFAVCFCLCLAQLPKCLADVFILEHWVDEPEGGASSLKPGDTVLFNFEWGWERGVVHPMAKCNRAQKEMAKECDTPVLVRYVIEGDYILQDFGGEDPSYLSREDFDKLRSGEEDDSLEVGLKSWCIVKLE